MTLDPFRPADVSDRIFLRDHVLDLDIGAFSDERGKPQRVAFSVWVDVASPDAGDDVDRILSYDTLLGAIDRALGTGRMALLETLAEEIARELLSHPQALCVRVRIEKLDRVSGRLGVEIARSGRVPAKPGTGPDLEVICLGANPGGAVLDWLQSGKGARLIAVDGASRQKVPDATAARRLSLLASEMAAWRLFAQLPGSAVVASRTEIEHLAKLGRTAIWAPSKMVFDAAAGVKAVPEDFARLAAWLARQTGAKGLTYVGVRPPAGHDFSGPVRELNP